MTPAYLHLEGRPHVPARRRAVTVMAVLGVVTGLISSLPSPLPDIRLSDPDVLINARAVPLHAGIAFGVLLAAVAFVWVNRDISKCLLALALTVIGWLAAANTANDIINAIQGSDLFGMAEGAKASREMLGWLCGRRHRRRHRRGAHGLRHRHSRRRHQADGGLGAGGADGRGSRPPALPRGAVRRHRRAVRAVAGGGGGGHRLRTHRAGRGKSHRGLGGLRDQEPVA